MILQDQYLFYVNFGGNVEFEDDNDFLHVDFARLAFIIVMILKVMRKKKKKIKFKS